MPTSRSHWFRGRQVGGRSIMWGRQVYRWSDLDFEANARDGHRGGLADPLRRHRAVVRSRGAVHRRERPGARGWPSCPTVSSCRRCSCAARSGWCATKMQARRAGRVLTIGRVRDPHPESQRPGGRATTAAPASGDASPIPTSPASARRCRRPGATGRLTLRPNSVVRERDLRRGEGPGHRGPGHRRRDRCSRSSSGPGSSSSAPRRWSRRGCCSTRRRRASRPGWATPAASSGRT